NHAKPDNFEDLEAGDLILLASGYTGGSPRTPLDEWIKHSLARVYVAPIVSEPFESSTPEWPDEPSMAQANRYVNRIKFDSSNLQTLSDISLRDDVVMSRALSDSLRKSGSNAGRGYILDAGEFRELPVAKEKAYWIFQGNPKHFDIDRYILDRQEITWSVRQYVERIHTGDEVLL